MFKYKIIQLQWESKIESNMLSCWDINLCNNLTESSHLFNDWSIQQIVKISLYSDIILDWFIKNNIEKEIQVNWKSIPLFVKVRY